MVAGSLLARRQRPGGPVAYYLSIHTPNNSRHRYVRKSELERLQRWAASYRECIRALAEWVEVNKAIERELRTIRKLRCEKLESPGRQGR